MLEWLAANWLPLTIVVAFVILVTVFLIKRKGLRQVAIDAIVWAEREFKTETGAQKMQNAIDYCQQIIPMLNLLPDELIKAFLQTIFDQIKEALEVKPTEKKTIQEYKEDNVG